MLVLSSAMLGCGSYHRDWILCLNMVVPYLGIYLMVWTPTWSWSPALGWSCSPTKGLSPGWQGPCIAQCPLGISWPVLVCVLPKVRATIPASSTINIFLTCFLNLEVYCVVKKTFLSVLLVQCLRVSWSSIYLVTLTSFVIHVCLFLIGVVWIMYTEF